MKVAVAAAVLAAAGICVPIRAETTLERGKRVVNECVDALGGDRFINMQNREEGGRAYSFDREQLSGLSFADIYSEYETGVTDTAHNLAVRERQNFGKNQDNGVLFAEREAWEVTFRGARLLAQDRFDRYKDTTLHDVFYILRVRLKEPGMTFESRGADVLQNVPVEIVDATDADNRTTTIYFDQITKLPVRQRFERRDPKTRLLDEEITVYSKYREVGGVQWPFAITRERNGEKIYQIFSDHVEINRPLKPKLFELPSGMKVLKPL
jgi:hypothetical protein